MYDADMASCGIPPLIDGRHERVDFTMTLGAPWATQVCVTDTAGVPFDLTGATVEAGLMDGTGAEVFTIPAPISYGTGCITLTVSGADSAAEPLGVGSWEWFLRVTLPTDGEGRYWLGGRFSIYRVGSWAAAGDACGPDVVGVCVGTEITLAVDSCTGAQGAPGGQAHVGPLPPANLVVGMMWVMTPDDHIAVYTASGWKPVWPDTGNLAVEAGDAMLGIEGLWVSSDTFINGEEG